eukprot:gnl/TRDRNA2_/TRDRNA2_44896_c0_seq1.p1 gnl/TRDRNA2_/TRDRNA2_44896_c0~~gnl/TRDRNA2_/TRDRNA2_44896_c0_seq1.p1  ORF type:complete len:368 (-),score=59.16 gnl/TRDRNA2_/TRDRNA2_44896_c0_seq1:35-1138(-)
MPADQAEGGAVARLSDMAWRRITDINRVLTGFGYPLVFVIQAQIYRPPTVESARFFWQSMLGCWVAASCVFYSKMWSAHNLRFSSGTSVSLPILCAKHFFWFWMVDAPFFWMFLSGKMLEPILGLPREQNRFFNKAKKEDCKFKGKKICILGNGPSLASGDPLGDAIDSMDEVIRFNNFQTKSSGLERWTGHKTTVHFSDSMLYPTYPEYKVPGASVVLSLFADRLMVSGSYLIFRMACDLAVRETWEFLSDPHLGWIPHEDIAALKKRLGIVHWRHPTSGILAIDWFVRHRPDESEPIYIHGFDFFEGDVIHYYDKTEPLYERINDLVGVKVMHEPHKEKAFVQQLVEEGKVRWLRDYVQEKGAKA